jgi:hypothetical protein
MSTPLPRTCNPFFWELHRLLAGPIKTDALTKEVDNVFDKKVVDHISGYGLGAVSVDFGSPSGTTL